VPFLLGTALSMQVIHEDEALVVVDKPAGLLAVPGRGADKQDCLWRQVQALWPDALVVHRLDMATSGLMLFARGAHVQRQLSEDFAARRIHKHYVAMVDGRMPGPAGCIELPLAADWPRRPLQKVDAAQGKPSRTDWQVLAVDEPAAATRLALQPQTGRTHQLRVHLAAIGHPILGDALYAPPPVHSRAARLLLHASGLWLAHPSSGVPLQLHCAAPF
jgi:tRNA pseudouridine32 synthase/23S rRNA pseudouridine746 synthase